MVLTRQVMEVVEEEEKGEREAGLHVGYCVMVLTRQLMEVVEEEGKREAGLLTQTVSVELRTGWVKRME